MNPLLDSDPKPGIDPQARAAADAKHQALARGLKQLPNLAIRSAFTIFALYALLTFVLITVVQFGYLSSELALLIGIVFAVLQFTVGPWLMDLSLNWMYVMNWVQPEELPEHLQQFVTRVCGEHKMKFPSFGIIEDGAPQAFTYGHHPSNARVVLSRGTIEMLTAAELEGVVAHEIGHARNWDMALMTIVNLVPLLLFYVYRFLNGRGSKDSDSKAAPWYVTLGAYLLYIISEYIVLWFSRTREFYADRFAGRVTGNPNALASALIKIAYGLAAQDSKIGADTASQGSFTSNEFTSLNLSDREPAYARKASEQKPQRHEKREIFGTGALGALNIFDRKAAVSMVMSSANQGTIDVQSGLVVERIKSAMRWDMWNPWAKWYELNSTHPLVARRLEYLGDQAAALGQQPLVVFDHAQPESYWDEFAIDMLIMALPVISLIAGIGLALTGFLNDGQWQSQWLGIAIAGYGLGLLIKNLFRYRWGQFAPANVAKLMGEVKVSPVRPVPAELSGTIIGKGVPGLIYSEDFVLRDTTGILFLDYQQPLAIWNFLFGLLKAGELQGEAVRVKGWFRRAPVPYFEIYQMETQNGDARTCYTPFASYAWSLLLLCGGIALTLLWMGN